MDLKLGTLNKMIDSQYEEILLRKLSAQDLKTTVEDLQSLSNDPEIEVRKAAAGNPNMPLEILLKLGKEFPDEVIENPIFAIQLLEDPNSRFVHLSIARSSTISAKACETLLKDDDYAILCAIGENPATPVNVLEDLVHNPPQLDENDSSCDDLLACVARNRNTPVELLAELFNYHRDSINIGLAENLNIPIDYLEQLAIYRNPAVYRALLRNPNTPTSALEILAEENQLDDIKVAVKNHPNISKIVIQIADFIEGKPGVTVDTLEKLVGSKNTDTKLLVAEHPKASFLAFMILIKDIDKNVKINVISNQLLPEKVLEEFISTQLTQEYYEWGKDPSDSYSWYILMKNIVQHPNLSSESIRYFVDFLIKTKSIEIWVLNQLIFNHRTLPSTLTQLVEYYSQNAEQISKIICNTNPPSEAIEIAIKNSLVLENPNSIFIMEDIFMHPNILIERLIEFSDSQDEYICRGIAMNIKTPINILKKLAIHQNIFVRTAVGRNPNTPVSILSQLAADPSTRFGVAININTPHEILLKFIIEPEIEIKIQVAKNKKTPSAILATLAIDPAMQVREAVASNANTPVHTLQLLAQDPIVDVRSSLSKNPQLPGEISDFLMKDPSNHVALSRCHGVSHDILIKLSESEDIDICFELVQRGDLPDKAIQIVTKLAFEKMNIGEYYNKGGQIIFQVSKHPNTPAKVLNYFAGAIIETDKASVLAGNYGSKLREEINFWSNVLENLIHNPNVSIDIIEKLVIHLSDSENKKMATRKLRKM
jgi:Leucine rich repeat variant